jgi:hypothetical protein
MSTIADKLRVAAEAIGPEARAIAIVISGDIELCAVALHSVSMSHLTDEECAAMLAKGLDARTSQPKSAGIHPEQKPTPVQGDPFAQ